MFRGLSIRLVESRIGLIGNNGAGKTSLFRLLCGLERPAQGSVHVAGHDICAARVPVPGVVGMMFQNPDDQIIFPTVEEELGLSLQYQGMPRKEGIRRAQAFLAQRGLADWAQRAIGSLSHGQRQHVCWLALLLAAPRVMLLDEPFASLDLPGQARLATDIRRADQQVIASTHVLDHVRGWERVLWLHHGEIRGDGPGHEVCAAYEAHVLSLTAAMEPA